MTTHPMQSIFGNTTVVRPMVALALLLFLRSSFCALAAQARPAVNLDLPTITLDRPIQITRSVRIAPGQYHLPVPDGSAVIEIAADNVVLDLSGVTIESGTVNAWDRVGVGIHAKGHSHISVRGGTIRGYRFNVFLEGEAGTGSDIKIVGTNLSGSRSQQLLSTETHFDARDWVNIFDLDAWETYGAGLYLKNLSDIWVEHVDAHDAQNAIMIARTTHATIYRSDLSRNTGWGIALYGSSQNNLLDNHADWNFRCEGKSYSAGCDSAGILLMEGSNHNKIVGNSFTHSGDGYFLSKSPQGNQSESNYVAFNDGSYSFHNSFESVFTAGDQFYHNTARHSDYGFWLSFSRDSSVIDNDIDDSRHDGIAIEHGENNSFIRNRISSSGGSGIRLFCSGSAPEPSRGYAILDNVLTGDKVAILVDKTSDVTIQDNEFDNDGDGVKLEGAGEEIRSFANRVTQGQP